MMSCILEIKLEGWITILAGIITGVPLVLALIRKHPALWAAIIEFLDTHVRAVGILIIILGFGSYVMIQISAANCR